MKTKECEYCSEEFRYNRKRDKYCSDQCNRIGVALKNKGKKRSFEAKQKMSQSKKGQTLSQESRMKISNTLTGFKHSDETKKNMSLSRMGNRNVSKREDVRKKLSAAAKANIINGTSNIFKMKKKDTKPELDFEHRLKIRNIFYFKQYQVENKFYDFYIPFLHTLIEIDGDFHHANPKIYDHKNLTTVQKRTVENDLIKNKLAKDKGFDLMRIWSSTLEESSETREMNSSDNNSLHERPTFLECLIQR
jgi:very-short-patch-repair endonuclease